MFTAEELELLIRGIEALMDRYDESPEVIELWKRLRIERERMKGM